MSAKPDNVHVLIPKQLRLDWIDIMARDPDLSPVALRAAIVIGQTFDNKTGEGFISLPRLAVLMGVGKRTAWKAAKEAENAKYLKVRSRLGRGKANEYSLAIDGSQPSANQVREKIARLRELSSGKGSQDGANYPLNSSQDQVQKFARNSEPSLTLPTEGSLKGDFSEREKAADLIRHAIGSANFASWFGKCALDGDGNAVTLTAPDRFTADTIRQRYREHVVEAVKAVMPDVQSVTVVAAQKRNHA